VRCSESSYSKVEVRSKLYVQGQLGIKRRNFPTLVLSERVIKERLKLRLTRGPTKCQSVLDKRGRENFLGRCDQYRRD
jgi:hypothetical protein